MKKVLAIAPYSYLPYFSGGQKFIAHFLEWLGKETNLTVISVSTNDFSKAGSYKGLGWLKESKSRYIDRSLVKKIAELVREQGFESIILEHPYYAWLGFAIRKKTGIPVIIHTHNIEHQRFRSAHKWWWPILRNYEKSSFKKADALLFISPDDKKFATSQWGIPLQKCIDVPYGIEITSHPSDKTESRNYLKSRFGIRDDELILLFAGLLNYKPNTEAARVIIDTIYPQLSKVNGAKFRILVCGKDLPDELDRELSKTTGSIVYTGFVEDIIPYFKGADIFLNPVMSGGGVKTKIIEAIAAGTTVISTQTGAIGMETRVCGDKLIIVKDNNWTAFSNAVADTKPLDIPTPPEFYNHYFYGNIIKRVIEII